MKCHLITGGAGFIGSCYVLRSRATGVKTINLDKLTYSANLENLVSLDTDTEHVFVRGCIGNEDLVQQIFKQHQPSAVINFAAESHVDRSILDPEVFVRTNVLATCALLRVSLDYWRGLSGERKEKFRFLHVSTDEVYGTLQLNDPAFTEETPYAPNSPYSASKASSDHFVRAFYETYGFPVLLTNCSNNYGPRQFPEKLIPFVVCRALQRQALPVYGTGENIRDWLHVEDHCDAIAEVLEKGRVGRSYNIGGNSEKTNIDVVKTICEILDRLRPHADGSYADLISFVNDRLGHDFRYAINCQRIESELGWKPKHNFEEGLENTIRWYLDNPQWVAHIESAEYRAWIDRNYAGGTR